MLDVGNTRIIRIFYMTYLTVEKVLLLDVENGVESFRCETMDSTQ